jgi:hypothetical protein
MLEFAEEAIHQIAFAIGAPVNGSLHETQAFGGNVGLID